MIQTFYTTWVFGPAITGIYSLVQVSVAATSHRVTAELPINTAKTLNTRFSCL